MTNSRFRRQFLLTRQSSFQYAWKRVVMQDYFLYYHPELEFTCSQTDEKQLMMLGAIYDWETPVNSNQQLLDTLAHTCSFENFLTELSKYAGQYVILYCDKNTFILLNDACAQCEIYYDTSFSTFGSQPKLLNEVIESEPPTNQDAIDFFASREFLSKKLFVGDTTHVGNIKHLMPNHYIDVNHQTAVRYFPVEPVSQMSIKEVASKAGQMLKGYIKAVALREKIAMAVTSGYDSRVLFLASLGENCPYFVSQHKNMDAKHHDITIPQRLTQMYGRPFEVIPDAETLEDVSKSVDFPRVIPKMGKCFENHIYLNGNISEIARNFYGFHKNVSAEDLAFLNGYERFPHVVDTYGRWLKNTTLFIANGYNVLDMFYWEERTGIMVAKEKTTMNALRMKYFSPFCSRDLIVLLLSTPRKDRDHYVNKLYNSILLELSPNALKVPINPCFKQDVIRLMIKFKIYNVYRNLGLKYRFLKF